LRCVVVDDVGAAFALVWSGSDVVLLLAPGVDPGPLPEGPGRLAVMVGEAGDADAVAAAEAMYAELFPRRDP
jgi:hypothetical protein